MVALIAPAVAELIDEQRRDFGHEAIRLRSEGELQSARGHKEERGMAT
jgi:hypothetical protein